ncbi:phage tail tape measure protein [Photobacterium ganghwense]|uniref:phage tail tape measure protein n=1 Tax=Photobacterium ganghwense TaxID=320778 RepID=UPI0039F0E6DC
MSLPEPLRFTVGLIDQISKPLGDIQRQFGDMTRTYRDGTHTMVAGAAGVAGAGFALQAALMPAIEMDRALGDLKALGVADDSLKAVSETALSFSAEFGQSVIEVIRNAEGVKNAMGDMPADVMASVTNSSAMLTMAMKSDADTVSRYMKNLYGNYQQQADAMGKDAWFAQVAGMTAEAKRLYGVEMGAIEGMVDGMHSLTSTMGVPLKEQLAIFGMLSSQMSEGDAVTQYTNFLEGAVGAQEKLGISLTDSTGQLLPMQKVLENIAPLINGLSGADARTLLDDAGLGDGSLMLINMVKNMDEFKTGLESIGKVNGLDPATEMAATMADQWQRLEQGIFSVKVAFGQALLPVVLPVVQMFADGANEILLWTKLFPNITRYIGYATIGFFGLVAAGGVINMLSGAMKMAWATLSLGVGLIKSATGVVWMLTKGFTTAAFAVVKFSMALLANPVFLMVAAITAAVVAVGALIYYWDDLKASFGDTTWFQILAGAVTLFSAPFVAAFNIVKGGWQWVMSGFTDTSGFDGLFVVADSIRNVFGSVFGWITEQLSGLWDMAKGVMDWLPGFGGDETEVKSTSVQQALPRSAIPPGGAARSIASYQTSSTHYGGVSIYAQQMNSPQDFANEMEMFAG